MKPEIRLPDHLPASPVSKSCFTPFLGSFRAFLPVWFTLPGVSKTPLVKE